MSFGWPSNAVRASLKRCSISWALKIPVQCRVWSRTYSQESLCSLIPGLTNGSGALAGGGGQVRIARAVRIRHHTISDQVGEINAFLRGHYAYYGVAGNLRCLVKVYRAVERYWRKMLRSRSWAGRRLTWEKYNQIKARMPLLKPKLRLPYAELQALA